MKENKSFLTNKQYSEYLKKLRKNNPLENIWEIIIFNLLSKTGIVENEKNFNGKYPDIYFQQKTTSINFLADITTISDKVLHKENKKLEFYKALKKFFKKNGISLKGLDININGFKENSKTKLSLQKVDNLNDFIETEFTDIIKAIKINPKRFWQHKIKKNGINLDITFNPNSKFTISSHTAYTYFSSYSKNVLYKALKRKYDQLKVTRYEGNVGIFICDGDCDLLKNNHKIKEETIKYFLSKYTYIDFVFISYFETTFEIFAIKPVTKIKTECYISDNLKTNHIFLTIIKKLKQDIENIKL